MNATTTTTDPLYATLRSTGRLVWGHLPTVVLTSVLWVLASLPLLTAGPATVGVYHVVLSLRAEQDVDWTELKSIVRTQFVHAALLGMFPVVLLAIAVNYGLAYLSTGAAVPGLFAVLSGYLALFVAVVLVPTFVALARGEPVDRALQTGYLFAVRHVVATGALIVVTGALVAVTSVLTVAFVLLFAGTVGVFHVELLATTDDRLIDPSTEQMTETTHSARHRHPTGGRNSGDRRRDPDGR